MKAATSQEVDANIVASMDRQVLAVFAGLVTMVSGGSPETAAVSGGNGANNDIYMGFAWVLSMLLMSTCRY